MNTNPNVVEGGCTNPRPPGERVCSHSDCGNANPPYARFCGKCGRPLGAAGASAAPRPLQADWIIHPITIISTLFLVAAVSVVFAGGAWHWALPFFGVFAFGQRWGRSRRRWNRWNRRF